MEDVLPPRKRGSEDAGFPEDPTLRRADGSEIGISQMAVILTTLGVTPVISKVAELFC